MGIAFMDNTKQHQPPTTNHSPLVRVFLDSNPTIPGHAVRGMGRYAIQLLRALKEQKGVELVEEKDHHDIIHYPYFDFFFNTLPDRNNVPIVVTVHDTHPLIYPEHFPAGVRGRLRFSGQKKRLQKADAVIVNTETTKKDVVRFLDIPAGKIFVTHFAPNPLLRKLEIGRASPKALPAARNWKLEIIKRYGLPERFALYVGDINYNKNIPGLIRAFSLVAHHLPLTTHLVLVGKAFEGETDEAREIRRLIGEFQMEDKVHMLGFVSDEDLVKIYNLAEVYCQPSFYEGFGFPVLEAMACGTPVVAGETQALTEIGEGAALFVNPKNVQALAAGLEKVISDTNLKKELIQAGFEKVREFSWSKTASDTINVYKKVLGK